MLLLLDRLRNETSLYHQSLEKNLKLFDRIKTIEDYKVLITQLLAFYLPLEKTLQAHLETSKEELDLKQRQKTPLLQLDAQFLGAHPWNKTCKELPKIENYSSAIGCLYVLEGASLGGQIISKHFKKQFGLEEQKGLNFYIGYGPNTGRMWQRFREFVMLSSASREPHISEPQAIEGAISTFTCYGEWMCSGRGN